MKDLKPHRTYRHKKTRQWYNRKFWAMRARTALDNGGRILTSDESEFGSLARHVKDSWVEFGEFTDTTGMKPDETHSPDGVIKDVLIHRDPPLILAMPFNDDKGRGFRFILDWRERHEYAERQKHRQISGAIRSAIEQVGTSRMDPSLPQPRIPKQLPG